jgi:hypothetical protein
MDYMTKEKGIGKKKAIVAVARRLEVTVHAVEERDRV